MAIKNEKPTGQRARGEERVTNWPFEEMIFQQYDTKWQDALDVKHNLFPKNNGVILMLAAEGKVALWSKHSIT